MISSVEELHVRHGALHHSEDKAASKTLCIEYSGFKKKSTLVMLPLSRQRHPACAEEHVSTRPM